MTHIIAFATQKGGVGKTTLCAQLAQYLTRPTSKRSSKPVRVLCVDCDEQANLSFALLPQYESYEDMNLEVEDLDGTYMLMDGSDDVPTPMACTDSLDLIPTAMHDFRLGDCASASDEDMQKARDKMQQIAEAGRYDFILIDTGPARSRVQYAAMLMADHVLCPVRLEHHSASAVAPVMKSLEAIDVSFDKQTNLLGIVPMSYGRREATDTQYIAEQLEEAYGDYLFKNGLPTSKAIMAFHRNRESIWTIRHTQAARSNMEALGKEFLKRLKQYEKENANG
tara:strand:+ start:7232 stop:8074 length:843 start_codon:yes stop_codon:yes gene_type:complete